MKKILETEKNFIRGAAIKKIQDKATEFKEQLNKVEGDCFPTTVRKNARARQTAQK